MSNIVNSEQRNSKQKSFYRNLLASARTETCDPNTFSQSVDEQTYFVTFRKGPVVIDVVVSASGKKEARIKAQAIVAGKALCGDLKYVGVN